MKLPLKWEFPGGKIEDGESEIDCVKREVLEELNIHIKIGKVNQKTPSSLAFTTFTSFKPLKPVHKYIEKKDRKFTSLSLID